MQRKQEILESGCFLEMVKLRVIYLFYVLNVFCNFFKLTLF